MSAGISWGSSGRGSRIATRKADLQTGPRRGTNKKVSVKRGGGGGNKGNKEEKTEKEEPGGVCQQDESEGDQYGETSEGYQ